MPSSPAICASPNRRRYRAFTIRLTTAGGVRVGIDLGLLERSIIPAGPSTRNLASHLRAVGGETMNIFAATATATGHRSSTMSFASRKRARGVRAASAWDTKASCVA